MTQILIEIEDCGHQLQQDVQKLDSWIALIDWAEQQLIRAWQEKIDQERQGFEDSFQFTFGQSRRNH